MHNCPDCGQACYCNGDIDDCQVGDHDAFLSCTHCNEAWIDDEMDYDEAEADAFGSPAPATTGKEGE